MSGTSGSSARASALEQHGVAPDAVEPGDPRADRERLVAGRVVQGDRGAVLREDRGLQGPEATLVGLVDLPPEQRLADATTAGRRGDVHAGLADARVARSAGDRRDRGPADDPAVELGDPAMV